MRGRRPPPPKHPLPLLNPKHPSPAARGHLLDRVWPWLRGDRVTTTPCAWLHEKHASRRFASLRPIQRPIGRWSTLGGLCHRCGAWGGRARHRRCCRRQGRARRSGSPCGRPRRERRSNAAAWHPPNHPRRAACHDRGGYSNGSVDWVSRLGDLLSQEMVRAVGGRPRVRAAGRSRWSLMPSDARVAARDAPRVKAVEGALPEGLAQADPAVWGSMGQIQRIMQAEMKAKL